MNNGNAMDGISIVVTYYNEQKELGRCLFALAEAWSALDRVKRESVEITVVDDASYLKPEKLPTEPKINVVRQSVNQGVGAARNTGAEMAIYSYVHFMDADVIVAPDFLERLFTLLSQDHTAKVVQGHYSKKPANKIPSLFNHYMALSWYYNSVINVDALSHATFINSGCVTFEKSYFQKIGGYPAEYSGSGGEEYEMLVKLGDRVIFQDQTLINHHIYDSFVIRLKKLWRRGRNYFDTVVKNDSIPVNCKVRYSSIVLAALIIILSVALSFHSWFIGLVGLCIASLLYAFGSHGLFGFLYKEKGILFGLAGIGFHLLEFLVASFAMGTGLVLSIVGRVRLSLMQLKAY